MKKQLLATTALLLASSAYVAPTEAAGIHPIFAQTTKYASATIKDLTWAKSKQVLTLPNEKNTK